MAVESMQFVKTPMVVTDVNVRLVTKETGERVQVRNTSWLQTKKKET